MPKKLESRRSSCYAEIAISNSEDCQCSSVYIRFCYHSQAEYVIDCWFWRGSLAARRVYFDWLKGNSKILYCLLRRARLADSCSRFEGASGAWVCKFHQGDHWADYCECRLSSGRYSSWPGRLNLKGSWDWPVSCWALPYAGLFLEHFTLPLNDVLVYY